ncbi:BZ3500_MvSof-1268-A1-R1_Chr2-1g04327 [Microbotryum saponariae]|uniref:BZ3500_MvSof-1268-A1-R1_Chr2-1g04327 protein n=1 Tax=Microbotryum saponariae TaxID=289078 RepID=A0A2X0MII3_9BASI|nr:BZ3500_MvSof-1268-A1-R1_Chr2-1g04327 [Microbotryum saponariae]SCZ91445.1 BZ3501_MvSof-1269-A2-R1_Chr2-1g03983 [Microbotryum saponariae]
MPGVVVLPQAAGYGVVLGIGLFFSALMVGLTWVQNRYTKYKATSVAEFTSASHSVKPGLIASGIVSAWTWAATLLQSSAVCYKFGISGSWWYAAGATVQVLLFAQNSAKLKTNAPNASTFLEVIRTRWGTLGHATFGFFALCCNILVSSMLITGGSATVTDLTGMSTHAACMLIPVGVVIYVLIGGLRSSLLADYLHTTFIFSIILTFMFTVYTSKSAGIGSPKALYERLTEIAKIHPVKDNAQGSYLTMRSKSGTKGLHPLFFAQNSSNNTGIHLDYTFCAVLGLIFGVINIIGNFGTVYCDQAYWQRAIASEPASCVKAFILGGTAWTSIPLGFATTMGLAAVYFQVDLTPGEVSAGLPAAAAAVQLLGKTGAILMLILLFLAVTSAASAELVAVSSLFTYDVYIPYINPRASDSQILKVDHIAIVAYGVIMGLLGIIFFEAGISMGWLYEFMGCLIGSAVAPIALAIMSAKANRLGCIAAAWIGLAVGIAGWLGVAAAENNGKITIDTTFQDYPMLTGNLLALGVSCIIAFSTSWIWPENFDWEITRAIHSERDHFETAPVKDVDVVEAEGSDKKETEAESPKVASARASFSEEGGLAYNENKDPAKLRQAFKLAVYVSVVLFFLLIIAIPLPLFFSSYVFPQVGFTVWIAITFIWVFYGSFAVVIYPIYESYGSIAEIGKAIYADVTGKRVKDVAPSEE